METSRTFLMAGGGTGGHVIPLIAVARILRNRGHRAVFVGTRTGMEARLVPKAGFEMEWIETGALNRVGLATRLSTVLRLPDSVLRARGLIARHQPAAVFSLGGYVAAPVLLAAVSKGTPVVVMEPNALPGAVHRWLSRWVARALVSFSEAQAYFPAGRCEITGVPVRAEFFAIEPREPGEELRVLITGGSQGSRTLNRAVEQCWPLLAGQPVRLMHQTGAAAYSEIAARFAGAGVAGDVAAFIEDMPAAFAAADLIVSRAGAGACAEIAAAGKPSILVPFPFAADDHQTKNAEAFVRAGAARMIPDREMNGARLFQEIKELAADRGKLAAMAAAARRLARPDAAQRAVTVLEEIAGGSR
jgi:UDP-N-acetylglucosamine--N-acetylmuramyl-(pentapeptide) pyrophosphoryl-undecaprenol N-acetylglucosamine transferase